MGPLFLLHIYFSLFLEHTFRIAKAEAQSYLGFVIQ